MDLTDDKSQALLATGSQFSGKPRTENLKREMPKSRNLDLADSIQYALRSRAMNAIVRCFVCDDDVVRVALS